MFVTISISQQVKSLKSISKFFNFSLLFLLFFAFFSCKSTNSINKNEFSAEEPYLLKEDISFPQTEEPYKFIFIRFYNPVYSNPLYYANLLKNLIKITEITDFTTSHSAIGFSLDDNFYGLSASGSRELKIEHCTDSKSNTYMKNCNPKKSEQLTIALKVRESEYENIKKEVEASVDNPLIRYDVGINFPIGSISINRKFFAKKENKKFGTVKYPKRKDTKKIKEYENGDFVCCTYIATVLNNNVPEINQWFLEHNVDYQRLTVSDLIYLPNTVQLFYSNWENYELAALAFATENPEFLQYLNN